MTIPEDIVESVHERLQDPTDRRLVSESLHKLRRGGLNVGPEQLARASVFLSDGDRARFSEVRASFLGDPRDVLVHAHERYADTASWFDKPLGANDRPT